MDGTLHKVFVYGTLKRRCRANFMLHGHKLLGQAISAGSRYALWCNGSFPYLTVQPKGLEGHRVVGEIYQVDQETFERLDAYEGYPHHYNREKRHFRIDGKEVRAWVYLKHQDHDNPRVLGRRVQPNVFEAIVWTPPYGYMPQDADEKILLGA